MAAPELSERKQRLLMALVERHIRDGQPVGSKTLAEGASLQVSPATIRNIMAELEDIGVLASPHTSAGRIPTEVGYRLYVDALLRSAPMLDANARGLKRELEQLIDPDQSPTELVAQASRALAELTRMAGVLVILVINRAEVQNRVIHTDREYGESELRQAANYINRTYAGCDLDDICDGLLKTMAADKRQMDLMMQTTMDVAAKALRRTEKESGEQYVVSGEANLLDSARGDDLDKLRDLFDAFNSKRDILHLLERSVRADGVQIFIGREAGYQAFDEYSLVSAPYRAEDQTVGVLAVVGPTRMDYERVIPTVDITARILSAALRNG
jgi:heat-inducible transcriptional repressor